MYGSYGHRGGGRGGRWMPPPYPPRPPRGGYRPPPQPRAHHAPQPPHGHDHTSRDFYEETCGNDQILKVAGSSKPKSLAGAIAKRMREGGTVKLIALGPASVNQAVKALAIARSFLAEDGQVDLTVLPEFIHVPVGKEREKEERSAIRFTVLRRPYPKDGKVPPRDPSTVELKVSQTSQSRSTAGALAKRIREGQKCVIVGIGGGSVNQAVKSVAIANSYLADDYLEINFKPKFIHVDLGEEQKSAVEMTILYNQL
eukprot:TRINITY_DN67970_c3_g1_i1.p1 TRINITY_DN67970_c3_g1~~TRINITY_DN67970_c3_g1_i1.p1  ORF type:complete len:267 (-),score=17.48 TRINITY_DN67970_c3_g1_i1:172-939(-)